MHNIVSLKQLLAILLLLVLFFNLAGYNLWFEYIMTRSDRVALQKIDRDNFDESNLVELKAALPVPYLTDWTDYERVNGIIEINGSHYVYVKRKVQRDSIFVLCLPNEDKSAIAHDRDRYGHEANNLPSGKTEGPQSRKMYSGFDFIRPVGFSALAWAPNRQRHWFTCFTSPLPYRFPDDLFRPPDRVA